MKILEQLFQLRYAAKLLSRDAAKCSARARKEKAKLVQVLQTQWKITIRKQIGVKTGRDGSSKNFCSQLNKRA